MTQLEANAAILQAVIKAPDQIGMCLMVGAQAANWRAALSVGMQRAAKSFLTEEETSKADPGETMARLEGLLGAVTGVIYSTCGAKALERALERVTATVEQADQVMATLQRATPGQKLETPDACASCAYAKPAAHGGDEHCIMFRVMPRGVCAKWRGES